MAFKLNPKVEADRLLIATKLWERFCSDLVSNPSMARTRLTSGIQVALRDAADGVETELIYPTWPVGIENRVGQLEEIVRNLDPAGRPARTV